MATLRAVSLLCLVTDVLAQQIGTNTPEQHPPMPLWTCTAAGCTVEAKSVTLDANWRWIHDGKSGNCYTGTAWDPARCPDPTSCSRTCALDGVDSSGYASSYGVSAADGGIQLGFVTKTAYGSNFGSRLYMMEDERTYRLFRLLNREFTFTVDVRELPCGLNGAVYFVEMEADGGQATSGGLNAAGAKYGTGYCDAQCPHDLKFIGGLANLVDWNATADPPVGKYGSCCAEMDIWEANSRATAYTPHPCKIAGSYTCSGMDCGDNAQNQRYEGVCDKDGCDFNPFRLRSEDFFGDASASGAAPFLVDSSKEVTVVTQFITSDGTDEGDLVDIRRLYVQNGRVIMVIMNSRSLVDGVSSNSVNDQFCGQMKEAFGDVNDFQRKGGLRAMGEALRRGMVLVFSLWDDSLSEMLWLDSTFPVGGEPSTPGVRRGPCPTDSSSPKFLRANFPHALVKYRDVKVGEIGSTFGSASAPVASSTTLRGGVSPPPSPPTACAKAWQQCGGKDWQGTTCCEAGATCEEGNPWYSQCLPASSSHLSHLKESSAALRGAVPPPKGCAKVWQQCGGKDWQGATCCEAGATCEVGNLWYSQCLPASSMPSTSAPSSSSTTQRSEVSSPPSSACARVWEQCGAGKDWRGPTCCEPGTSCEVGNEWYSQCLRAPSSP